MSEAAQMRLVVRPTLTGLHHEIRDEVRSYGRGTVATWGEVRGLEIRSGIACVQLVGPIVDDAARALAAVYGWEVLP